MIYISLFHLFAIEFSGNFGNPLCYRRITKSANGECRNVPDAGACFVPPIYHLEPINFLRGVCIESSCRTDKLSIRKSSYRIICRNVAANDRILCSVTTRATVLRSVEWHRSMYRCDIFLKRGEFLGGLTISRQCKAQYLGPSQISAPSLRQI